jgi:peptidoglycan/LPS O-acetylase OafA/YrhL
MRKLFSVNIGPNRIFGLDILRAIAILSVMVSHSKGYLSGKAAHTYGLFGIDGVSIFFVLSGFLIGGILIKILEKEKHTFNNLLNFWIKRWMRTVPPYVFVLSLLLLLESNSFDLYRLKYFLFLQNLYQPHPGFFPEAWSLSVEEWFYLSIAPLIFFLCSIKIKPSKSIFISAVFVLLSITLYRYLKYLNFNITDWETFDNNFRKVVITRMDSLMYGVIAAYLSYYFNDVWLRFKTLLLIIGITLFIAHTYFSPYLFPQYGVYYTVFAFSVVSFATLLLLPYLSQVKTGSGLYYSTITKLSLISYSMYLLNFRVVAGHIISSIFGRVFGRLELSKFNSSTLSFFMFWIITIALSVLMYNCLEVPSMRLRNKVVAGLKVGHKI